MNKTIALFSGIVAVIVAIFICATNIHSNDIQNFQVVQSLNGDTRVQSNGGVYLQIMPKIWTYPKVHSVFFSNNVKESEAKDGIDVIFQNKGKGDISCQVVVRLFTNIESINKMHQYAAGNIEIVQDLVLSKLKDIAMEHASNITSSQAVEDREALAMNIRKDFVNNRQLAEMGIVVEQFSITKIDFDQKTTQLFSKQQEADLQKKTAEAEKLNLQMQKEKTVAQYEQQVAESKGKAEVEKIKAVTDAERQKELAEIKGKEAVAVAELEKKKAAIEANKKLEVVEIQKREEKAKLEVIQIQAEQKVAEARAKEQQIKLSGAMSEQERIRLEIEKEIKIGVAKAIAEGLSKTKLPSTFIMGGTGVDGKQANAVEMLMQLLVVKEAKNLQAQK